MQKNTIVAGLRSASDGIFFAQIYEAGTTPKD
jgi:hypothetical protein